MPYCEQSHHPHVSAERAYLFTSENPATIEDQYRTLIASLLACTSPHNLLEVGCGASTYFINRLPHKYNHFLVESNPAFIPSNLSRAYHSPTLNSFIDDNPSIKLGFVILDNDLPSRANDLLQIKPLLEKDALVFIHDTSPLRILPSGSPDPATAAFYRDFSEVRKDFNFINFPLSRGALLLQPRT